MAKVLLVLGNGFDIKCGSKSTYTDYLESSNYSSTFDKIISSKNEIDEIIKTLKNIGLEFFLHNKVQISSFDSINFWDLFFGLAKYFKLNGDYKTWTDIEKHIYCFLRDGNDEKTITNVVRCKNLDSSKYGYDYRIDYLIILYIYMTQKNIFSHSKDNRKSINYSMLLEDLKKFEKKFGEYICQETSKPEYIINSKNLISELVGKSNELGGIDTFNYSTLQIDDSNKIWHINGDYNFPIFGIDDNVVVDSTTKTIVDMNWYIFTKIYRRLELYGQKTAIPKNKEYSGIIVYGHSLNEQDYSYFYPLFNQLDFTNSNKASRNGKYIIFKYSAYEGCTSDQAKEKTIVAVVKMLERYNREILNASHFRLLNILFNQNRIRFEEVK